MFEWIPTWEKDRTSLCERISRTKADLKIILKTKDEIYLLRRWLSHHITIVGAANIIVFDNMSSDPEIDKIYEEYREQIIIARFSGYQDDIHIADRFPELYAAIAESARFFVFLDTDEYLIWLKDDLTWIKDSSILQRISAREESGVLPAAWLGNVPFFHDRFYVGSGDDETGEDLGWGLKWGKPVISTKADFAGNLLHNAYLDFKMYEKSCCLNVFILHLASFSPEQRIASNMRKLRAIKFISDAENVQTVLARDANAIGHPLIRGYVDELRELAAIDLTKEPPGDTLEAHTLRLNCDGTITFFNAAQGLRLKDYLSDSRQMIARFLKPAAS